MIPTLEMGRGHGISRTGLQPRKKAHREQSRVALLGLCGNLRGEGYREEAAVGWNETNQGQIWPGQN